MRLLRTRHGGRNLGEVRLHLWRAGVARQRGREPADAASQHATASKTRAVTGGVLRVAVDHRRKLRSVTYGYAAMVHAPFLNPEFSRDADAARLTLKQQQLCAYCEPCDLPCAPWHDRSLHRTAAARSSPPALNSTLMITLSPQYRASEFVPAQPACRSQRGLS